MSSFEFAKLITDRLWLEELERPGSLVQESPASLRDELRAIMDKAVNLHVQLISTIDETRHERHQQGIVEAVNHLHIATFTDGNPKLVRATRAAHELRRWLLRRREIETDYLFAKMDPIVPPLEPA